MIYRFGRVNDAWLELRQKHLTATDFASLFDLNNWMDTEALIASKVHRDRLDNKFLRDGKILEPAVIQAIKEDLGWDVGELAEGSSLVFTNDEHKISSTPDAFRWDDPAVVECKTVNAMTFNRHWRNGTAPLRYVMQVHIQMLTTSMQKGFLAGITAQPNVPLAMYEITPNKELYEVIFHTADTFWENWRTNPAEIKRLAGNNYRKQLQLIKDSVKFLGVTEYPEEKPAELSDDIIFGKG